MATPFIYVGGLNWDYYYDGRPYPGQPTIHVFDRSENLISSFATDGDVVAIAVDSDGCIYINQNPTSDPANQTSTTCKYTLWGDLIWKATHGTEEGAILGRLVLDNNNNVYTFGMHVDENGEGAYPGTTTRKYSSDGVLQWGSNHGLAFFGLVPADKCPIAVAGDGSLVITGSGAVAEGSTTTNKAIQAFDSDGELVWSYGNYNSSEGEYLRECWALTIDDDDNVYVGARIASYRIYKLNSSGAVLATSNDLPADNTPVSIKIDSSGDLIILCTDSVFDEPCLYKFDSDLNLVWTSTAVSGWNYSGLALDEDDGIYLSSQYFPSGFVTYTPVIQTVVLESDGTADFTIEYLNSSTQILQGYPKYCVAVQDPLSIPPLPINLNLGLPDWQGDKYTNVPAISINFSLSAPQYWQDYSGSARYPSIYRFYLTGTPNIELPLSSINCRYSSNTVTLTAIVPNITADIIDLIEDRADGELVLYRGQKFSDTLEQINEMLRVPFDSLRYDFGSNSGSITLSGTANNSQSVNTRIITGISYRNTINSLRRVRCEIDTYLRPGDTADLGNGETLIVSEIVYYISLSQAFMEISE